MKRNYLDQEYRIIGQLFDTYWLVESMNSFILLISMPAAGALRNTSWNERKESPPIFKSADYFASFMQEEEALNTHMDILQRSDLKSNHSGESLMQFGRFRIICFSIAKKRNCLRKCRSSCRWNPMSQLTPDMGWKRWHGRCCL